MLVKATVGFSGTITMSRGELRDIPKGAPLDDLLRAGHVVAVSDTGGAPAETSEARSEDKAKPKGKGEALEAE